MAPVAFSQHWKRRVEDEIASGERMADIYAMLVQLRDPAYVARSWIVPVVTQPWGHRSYDWYDAAAIDEVGALAKLGLIAVSSVPVDSPPGRDREQQVNQERLDQLEPPFAGTFLGGAGDNDGPVSWSAPIQLNHVQGDGSAIVLEYQPNTVPLEVGHVQPETVLWHLRVSGGVARWPYSSRALTLLLTTRRLPNTTRGRALKPTVVSGKRIADLAYPESDDPRRDPSDLFDSLG